MNQFGDYLVLFSKWFKESVKNEACKVFKIRSLPL